jgi:tetratricopeptide (TPR) repeat protein
MGGFPLGQGVFRNEAMILRGAAACLLLAMLPAFAADTQTEQLCANFSGSVTHDDEAAACDKWIAGPGERSSSLARAHVLRAQLRLRDKDLKGAREDLDSAIALDADNSSALIGRTTLEEGAGEHEAALADSERALKLADDPAPVHLLRARIFLVLHRYPEAIAEADFDRIHGGAVSFLNLRCRIRAIAGVELDKARTACDQALWAAPDAPMLLDSRGLLNLKQQRWQAAWNDYGAVLAAMPRAAAALYGRGLAALKLGKEEEGRADLAAATRIRRDIAEEYAGYGLTP